MAVLKGIKYVVSEKQTFLDGYLCDEENVNSTIAFLTDSNEIYANGVLYGGGGEGSAIENWLDSSRGFARKQWVNDNFSVNTHLHDNRYAYWSLSPYITDTAEISSVGLVHVVNGQNCYVYRISRKDNNYFPFIVGDLVASIQQDYLNENALLPYNCAEVIEVSAANNTIHVKMLPGCTNFNIGQILYRYGNVIPPFKVNVSAGSPIKEVKHGNTTSYENIRANMLFGRLPGLSFVSTTNVQNTTKTLAELPFTNILTSFGVLRSDFIPSTFNKDNYLIDKYLYSKNLATYNFTHLGHGIPVSIPNYRGRWGQTQAVDSSLYYRSNVDVYDTVTHNGALWKCNKTKTTTEPVDGNTDWIKMSAQITDVKGTEIWSILPNSNIISLSYKGYEPRVLTCNVVKHCNNASEVINDTTTLRDTYKLALEYSLDGIRWTTFNVGDPTPMQLENNVNTNAEINEEIAFSLENGAQIQAESSMDAIYTETSSTIIFGADNIDTMNLGNTVYFRLRHIQTNKLYMQTQIPIVKDGLINRYYGQYEYNTEYNSTNGIQPIVFFRGAYYALIPGKIYNSGSAFFSNPEEDPNSWYELVGYEPVEEVVRKEIVAITNTEIRNVFKKV